MKQSLPSLRGDPVRLALATFSFGLGSFMLVIIGLGLFALSGCGGGGGGGAGAGPAGGGAFAGSTVTINPTLQFSSGGVVSYTNAEAGSQFPSAPVAVVGTYLYTPSTDATTGTLDLTLPAPVGALSFTLKNFRVQGGNVTSFETVYAGRTFQAAVTVGAVAVSAGTSGGSVVIVLPPSSPGIPSFPTQPGSGLENSTITP
jgi:hypothetical protein